MTTRKKTRTKSRRTAHPDQLADRGRADFVVWLALRFERIEAKISALNYAALHLTVRAALDEDDPIAEARLLLREAVEATGRPRSPTAKVRAEELSAFYRAVLDYFTAVH